MFSPTTDVTVSPIRSSTIPIAIIITVTVTVAIPITAGARASASAPTPMPSVFPVTSEQFPSKVSPNYFDVHEIAITTTVTVILLVLPTRGFTEIGNRGKIGNDGSTGVKPSLKCLESGCRLIFLPELSIYVSNHVIGEVITNVETLDLTELA